MEALGKPATFNQAVMSVRDGGKAVMIGLAPTGITSEVDITRLVRRQVLFSLFLILFLLQFSAELGKDSNVGKDTDAINS